MKKVLLIFGVLTAVSICCWAFVSMAPNNFEVPEEGITFHEVQLVCGAASDIGCGSRSKPILLDLEKEPTIKEAWLNRPGTIVAIVWNDDVEPNVKALPTIFKKHGKSFTTITGEGYKKQLASFKADKWYQGADVDELSMEEAGRIATQIIEQLVEFEALPKENEPKMFAEVEAYIQNVFMTLEDVSLLNSPDFYKKWEKDIQKIGEPYVHGGKVPPMEVFYPAGTSCKKDGTACCTKGKKGCYAKKGI